MSLRVSSRMALHAFGVLGALLAARPVSAQQPTTAGSAVVAAKPSYLPEGQSIKYDKEIQAFLDADRLSPPPKNGILFIGSSICRQWENIAEQMAPLPVYNRAFGGSRTWEVLHYVDQVVIPYAPAFVVYYCGSNDVNAKQDAAGIATRIEMFFDRVHEKLPAAQLFYVDIQKAPDKRARWAVVDSANATVRRYVAARADYMRAIDLNPVIFTSAGNPRGELYRPDSLHFYAPAYVAFSAVIKPVLEQAWAKRAAAARADAAGADTPSITLPILVRE